MVEAAEMERITETEYIDSELQRANERVFPEEHTYLREIEEKKSTPHKLGR